jgi:hypothetical protein
VWPRASAPSCRRGSAGLSKKLTAAQLRLVELRSLTRGAWSPTAVRRRLETTILPSAGPLEFLAGSESGCVILKFEQRLDSQHAAGILDAMETDLDKAREIVRKSVRFIGRMGMMHENIAIAVAEGIALGRKEGIAMAAEAVSQLKDENGT